jgi:putative transposase
VEVNEARRLRQLEDENGQLKKIVARQALDIDALQVVLSKKWARGRVELSGHRQTCKILFI